LPKKLGTGAIALGADSAIAEQFKKFFGYAQFPLPAAVRQKSAAKKAQTW